MYPKRLALPVFLMVLIALMWAIISFLLGVADAGAQSYAPPYNARVVAMAKSHTEHDVDGYLPGTTIPERNYRVQLELLGDRYIEANRLTYR